jgi:hypothetical protein
MRTACVILFALLACGCLGPLASAQGEKELLEKFKKQNEAGRERLRAEVKDVLEKVQVLEKQDPEEALGLLQDVYEGLLQKGLLTSKDDRDLAGPLTTKIDDLREMVLAQRAAKLKASLAEYKDYLDRMNEEFVALRKALVPPAKDAPAGEPAFFTFANGALAAGWLHSPPLFVVHATIRDEARSYAPGLVTGIQTAQAYYVYHPSKKQFVKLTNSEFFITAVVAYAPARRPGFWLPKEIPPPPPGFGKTSPGVDGAALFGRSVALLMHTWASPVGQVLGMGTTAVEARGSAAKLLREVMIDLQVQQSFPRMMREPQTRIRDLVMTFLGRRPQLGALDADESGRLIDLIADAYPDRRPEAVAFVPRLNLILEQTSARMKK